MTTSADVTVVIPNYNRTDLLRKAIRSVQDQTLKPLEVIVVDDCSSPEHAPVVQSIVESFAPYLNIKLLTNEENRGANYSRNRGIFQAKGRYIAFLDSDDLWMPEKLEVQLSTIDRTKANDTRPVLSATGRYRIASDGKILQRQFHDAFSPERIRQSNFIGTLSSTLVETWVARHVHGFEETLAACQDWDFFIRLSDYVQFVGTAETLCVYADHDETRISLNNKRRLRAHLQIYKRHLRSSLERSKLREFYRNIAEDLQEMRKTKRASRFYRKSVSLKPTKSRFKRWLFQQLLGDFLPREVPNIKQDRYGGYLRNLNRLRKDPDVRKQLELDEARIKTMLAR